MVDLHLHTNMSDGSDAPLELLEKIEAAGCKLFSVTDHDDLRANAQILTAMEGKRYAAQFITGLEFSSVFGGRNLHLLCYGFDPCDEGIRELVAKGARLRRERVAALFDHLRIVHGIVIPDADKADILGRAIPGKVHIADAAMKLGFKMPRREFFNNYLDDMESREFKVPAEKVIEAVEGAGGLVAFAHPCEVQKEYGIDYLEITKTAAGLKEAGLAAIEVYHSSHSERQVREYEFTARKTGLLISGGSDYHGKNKDVEIGRLTAYGHVPADRNLTVAAHLRGIELLLEEYNGLPPAREWVDSYAAFTYRCGKIRLEESNFSEWHLGFNIDDGEDGRVVFSLNRGNTRSFFAALGLKADDFNGLKRTVSESFNFAKRDNFYKSVLTRIEDVQEDIQPEKAYLKLLEQGKLPDYGTLERPLDKFVVFCLKHGIKYELKYQTAEEV